MALSKVFWDTNILVDFVLRRSEELAETDRMYEAAEGGQLRLFVSESVVATALYLCRKIGTVNLNLTLMEVLTVASVLANDARLMHQALGSAFKDKEDAILYHLAAHHRMDAFITRNKKDFARYALPGTLVMTPKEFVRNAL